MREGGEEEGREREKTKKPELNKINAGVRRGEVCCGLGAGA